LTTPWPATIRAPRVSVYTAPIDADPFALETIRMANPALGEFQNLEEVLAMARNAQRMPAREAAYKNLVLNMRVEASSPFVAPAQWQACNGQPFDLQGRYVFAGFDLSETRDLTEGGSRGASGDFHRQAARFT
jgi:phage terminase large subunit-like protein